MRTIFFLFSLILIISPLSAQTDSLKRTSDYPFIVQDAPSQLFTMRQFDQDYLSLYRFFARGLYSSIEKEWVADNIQTLMMLFLLPLTHEEGHRSILTKHNIGAISQPFFNRFGAAYVKGVRDQTLIDLRDNHLPDYIRLHTAGLESDYMLTKRAENVLIFDQDDYRNLRNEYVLRKLSILAYYVPGLFKYDVKLKEETDELERDVAGHDVYGAIRHLYRPSMDFYRYTRYGDLTPEEIRFVKRAGYRSLLNLLNPVMIKKISFRLNNTTRFNIGMGYTMSPFGDFIDENIWIKHNKLNLNFYARQFQNRENWFPGFGLGAIDYDLNERISGSLTGHFWRQPENFDFNTHSYFTGGAIDLELKYFFRNILNPGSFSIDVGMVYKTKGFLPEDVYLNEHLDFRIGTTIRIMNR